MPQFRNQIFQVVLSTMNFTLRPIGWIRKTKTKTKIVLYKKYQPGLMGVAKLSEIWVLWWFHRNDTPRLRSKSEGSSERKPRKSADRCLSQRERRCGRI